MPMYCHRSLAHKLRFYRSEGGGGIAYDLFKKSSKKELKSKEIPKRNIMTLSLKRDRINLRISLFLKFRLEPVLIPL